MNDQSLGLQQSICGKIVKIHRRQHILKNVNRIIMFGSLSITIFLVLVIFLSFFNPVFERIITEDLFFTFFLISLFLITVIVTWIEGFFSRIEKRLTNQLMDLYAPVDAHHVMSAISFSKTDDRPQYYLSRTLDLAYKKTLNQEAIEWPKLLWTYYHKNKKKEF